MVAPKGENGRLLTDTDTTGKPGRSRPLAMASVFAAVSGITVLAWLGGDRSSTGSGWPAHWAWAWPWAWAWAWGSLLLLGAVAVAWWLRLQANLAQVTESYLTAQRSAESLGTLVDHLPDLVLRLDHQGGCAYANAALLAFNGQRPFDVMGRGPSALQLPEGCREPWAAALRSTLAAAPAAPFVFSLPGPAGLRYWQTDMRLEPAVGDTPATVRAISRDITARHLAEQQAQHEAAEVARSVADHAEQLARSEARYRTIFDAAPIAISEEDWSGVQQLLRSLRDEGVSDLSAHLDSDPECARRCLSAVKLTRANQRAREIHSLGGKASGRTDLEALYGKNGNLETFCAELQAFWKGERLLTGKRSLRTSSGEVVSLMLTMSLPLLDDQDGTVLVCVADVSELDRLNADLDSSLARLRRVNQELETFTYSVSHDLKAPLRGIDGYSRLLLEDYRDKLDDEGRGFLEHIRRAAKQMGTLIDDLLSYSRLERRTISLAQLALAPVVESVVSQVSADFDGAGVRFACEIPSDLRVHADTQGLTMALRNLLDNALKFSCDSVPPCITVRAVRDGDSVNLSVQDNGVGFDMKFHDRIFAIFQRLHRAEEYPGTGVGLAIVRKAMERMGGQAWATSELGQGATFTLQLPGDSTP